MKLKIESPTQFYSIIPDDVVQNIAFRKELHSQLVKDKGMQKIYLELCHFYPPIFYSSALWTFNPKNDPGFRNIPFILRPRQIDVVLAIKDAIDSRHDLLIDKSRDEGATELITKFFVMYWLLFPLSMFLVGSRNENYVDKSVHVRSNGGITGDHKCLFHKIVYGVSTLPAWMQPVFEKTHLHLENISNGSMVDGETTTENFGAGDRRTAIMLDEFGRVDHTVAQSIRDSVSDVTDTVIYNSTHFYGRGHPYGKLRFSNKIKVITLPWHKNPTKNYGLYRSPDLNIIKLLDLDYYKDRFPKIFVNDISVFKYNQLEKLLRQEYLNEKITLVADGVDKLRSPWWHKEDARRDRRDMAMNIDMDPMGSGSMFFDPEVCQRIRNEKVRPPSFEGEVTYKLTEDGRIKSYKFVPDGGFRRLKWWSGLPNGRPLQSHNYIISADIALGNGASNSVIGIYDVNTREKVGLFVCPNTPPESLADQAVSIGNWVGGKTGQAFMIWESNGPGNAFDKRVSFHGYRFVYRPRAERTKSHKRLNKRGWASTGGPDGTKYDMLLGLRMALSEGLKSEPQHKALIVYDEATIGEYEDFIFYDNGNIGLSTCVDEDSGARSAHGDRVIPDGMAILAMVEQPKAALSVILQSKPGSLDYRRKIEKLRKQKEGANVRFIF